MKLGPTTIEENLVSSSGNERIDPLTVHWMTGAGRAEARHSRVALSPSVIHNGDEGGIESGGGHTICGSRFVSEDGGGSDDDAMIDKTPIGLLRSLPVISLRAKHLRYEIIQNAHIYSIKLIIKGKC